MRKDKSIILISVVGTSPAVLTETVWALAHQKKPVVPDEIVVITTKRGRESIENMLFGEDKGWERLKTALASEKIKIDKKLLFGLGSIVSPLSADRNSELEDIASTEENSLAADFFLETLRKYTERPDTQVYASIAGGRKTMSALMLSCMSLLGREDDHVLHVLVNPPFDGYMEPTFLFPEANVKYKQPKGDKKSYSSKDANIELIDLPFVKMRGWYQDKFKETYPSYTRLVSEVQKVAPNANVRVKLEFDFDNGCLFVDGENAGLCATEFIAFAIGIEFSPEDLYKELRNLAKKIAQPEDKPWVEWVDDIKKSSRFEQSDDSQNLTISHLRSEIKKKLSKFSSLQPFMNIMFPRGVSINTCPNIRISMDIKKLKERLGCDKICGR